MRSPKPFASDAARLTAQLGESFVFGEDRGDRYVSGLHLDLWGAGGVGEADELPLDPQEIHYIDVVALLPF